MHGTSVQRKVCYPYVDGIEYDRKKIECTMNQLKDDDDILEIEGMSYNVIDIY